MACGSITPTSASIFTWPSSLCLCVCCSNLPLLSFIKTSATGPRMISSQDPSLNCICKEPNICFHGWSQICSISTFLGIKQHIGSLPLPVWSRLGCRSIHVAVHGNGERQSRKAGLCLKLETICKVNFRSHPIGLN